VRPHPISTEKGSCGGTLATPATEGSINRKITVQASLGKNQDLISKIIRIKKAGCIIQAVEHLPSKWETLSSNHSNVKNK
jgi:hypothetical protein